MRQDGKVVVADGRGQRELIHVGEVGDVVRRGRQAGAEGEVTILRHAAGGHAGAGGTADVNE